MIKNLKTINKSFWLTARKNQQKTKGAKNFINKLPIMVCLLLSLFCINVSTTNAQMTAVEKYGQLKVSGNRIVDKNGNAVQLRGMSLYWSQWIGKYYTYNTVKWLRDDWKCTVVRAAMGINGTTDGYLVNPTAERNKVIAVVDAAIQLGIYVIIDWHDHNAHTHTAQSQAFFADMATRYGNTPNVIYETWNEPLAFSWASIIKPYHQAVVASIRAKDPDNIIICGTRNWSQQVTEAASDPVSGGNIAYTLHYYANTHGQWLRDNASAALSKGAALFVTEYGTTDATGNGTVNATASKEWWAFLDNNKIGHANWSVADIGESSAALISGASPNGGWTLSQIKTSGQLVRDELRAKAPDLSGGGGTTTYTFSTTTVPTAGGTVTRSPNAASYAAGTVVTLTAAPAAGYVFSSWSGGASGTSATTTVTVNANTTITANFTAIVNNSFSLTTSALPAAGGSITRSPNATSYANGTIVTLTAVPATGYSFTSWSGSVTGTSATTTVTMNANKTITANFTANTTGNTAPTVSLSAPLNGASFTAPATIAIAASAADVNGSISNVQFYNGTTLLGSDATSPYSFSWAAVSAGNYVITATATDNEGATTTSTGVTITVITGGTSTENIIGPDCGAANSTLTFELNTAKRTNVTAYAWWYTGASSGTTMVVGSPFRVNVATGNNFSAGRICVGTNLSVSPWYVSYCKSIIKCAAASLATVSPNPSAGAYTLKVSEAVSSYSVNNYLGTTLLTGNRINKDQSISFGNTLPPGNYVIKINYRNGKTETRAIQKMK